MYLDLKYDLKVPLVTTLVTKTVSIRKQNFHVEVLRGRTKNKKRQDVAYNKKSFSKCQVDKVSRFDIFLWPEFPAGKKKIGWMQFNSNSSRNLEKKWIYFEWVSFNFFFFFIHFLFKNFIFRFFSFLNQSKPSFTRN